MIDMARMKRGAKTQAVREYITANPDANPKAIVDGLKAQGITIKIGLANSVKYSKRGKSRTFRRGRRPAMQTAARRTFSTAMTVDQLVEVKRLADSLGGIGAIRQALEVLEQLQ
jgi:hypothetical protein